MGYRVMTGNMSTIMTREETNQRKAREGENKGKGEEERNMVKKKRKMGVKCFIMCMDGEGNKEKKKTQDWIKI